MEKITDTLVVPYQVEIEGEMYIITEVNITAYGNPGNADWEGNLYPKVKTIIFPKTIEKIYVDTSKGTSTFAEGNTTVKELILPENLKYIGQYAFRYMYNLKSIVIPKSVTDIEEGAFEDCGLETINYIGTEKEWGEINNCF